jgi:hypothetical protein
LIIRVLAYLWAAPYTALGLLLGGMAMMFGASARLRRGALEFGGGRLLRPVLGFVAITFGHVILGVDHATLAAVRRHEHVHVRQYERWGPFFGPAYLLSSLVQWLLRRDPYRDNRFEREAFGTRRRAWRR